jgi:hypothetical protein
MYLRREVLGDPELFFSDFDVIPYRGNAVATRAGWLADVKSRGGVGTRVPGGFWHDIEAGRFGSAPPYVYELPPVWLLVSSGIDVASDEFSRVIGTNDAIYNADNQLRSMASGITSVVKYAAIGVLGLVALNLLSFAPRRR